MHALYLHNLRYLITVGFEMGGKTLRTGILYESTYTLNITTFGIRHISAAQMRSYKSTPLIALNFAYNAAILSYMMSSKYFILYDSLEYASKLLGLVRVQLAAQILYYSGVPDLGHLFLL